MGRRSTEGMARGSERAHVLVLHPAGSIARRCALRFCAGGVVLDDVEGADAEGAVAQGRDRTLLRVPWWAVRGFCADDAVRTSDGELLQALDVVTDAGRLRLALRAADVAVTLSLLSGHALRWRIWRLSPARWMGRSAAYLGALRRTISRALARAVHAPRRRRALAIVMAAVALAAAAPALTGGQPGASRGASAPRRSAGPGAGRDARQGAGDGGGRGGSGAFPPGMARLVADARLGKGVAAHLAPAPSPPPPAPPSVADEPALSSHEVLGFVPYWTLGEDAGLDMSGFTTLAYFALSANANGTLDEAGTGWDGYESQAFADLVTRAHAAGARVVLTVDCFSLPAITALTSSRAAASALGASVVSAIVAKHLDGVNLDVEGGGPAQRSGLTRLVAAVSAAVHAANPRFQVTVDTDGGAAGDPGGFYDVSALASVADALFVMAYGLNYGAAPSAASPITSNELSDVTEAEQYAAAVPASKVIFGVPFFGYSWATTNGTMAAQAAAPGTPVTYAQVVASGHPIYWDPVTDTAWTSYDVGGQWYEDAVFDPASVYLVASLAQREGFAGVGAWALGMDGNDPQMTEALDGNAPAERAGAAGPASTAPSQVPRQTAAEGAAARSGPAQGPATVGPATTATSTTTTAPETTTTTTTTTAATATTATTTTTAATAATPTGTATSTPSPPTPSAGTPSPPTPSPPTPSAGTGGGP